MWTSRKKTWTEFRERMIKNDDENQKLSYGMLKNMRTRIENTLNRRRYHGYMEKVFLTPSNETQEKTQSEDIIRSELNEMIQKIKQGKAPGHDEIIPDIMNAINEEGKRELLKLITK